MGAPDTRDPMLTLEFPLTIFLRSPQLEGNECVLIN